MQCVRKTTLVFLKTVAAAVVIIRGITGVEIINSTYPCCEKITIPFDRHCNNYWSKDGKNFAFYHAKDLSSQWSSPCQEMKDGLMILDQCANVKLKTQCKEGGGIKKETWTNFYSQTCPSQFSVAENQGAGVVVLLFWVIQTVCVMIA